MNTVMNKWKIFFKKHFDVEYFITIVAAPDKYMWIIENYTV